MGKLQDMLNETIMETPMAEFQKSIMDVCRYIEEDGFPADGLRKAAETVTEDTEPLRRALDAYYGKPQDGKPARVLPQYEKAAGYLSCICGTIRDIEKKKRFTAEGKCNR